MCCCLCVCVCVCVSYVSFCIKTSFRISPSFALWRQTLSEEATRRNSVEEIRGRKEKYKGGARYEGEGSDMKEKGATSSEGVIATELYEKQQHKLKKKVIILRWKLGDKKDTGGVEERTHHGSSWWYKVYHGNFVEHHLFSVKHYFVMVICRMRRSNARRDTAGTVRKNWHVIITACVFCYNEETSGSLSMCVCVDIVCIYVYSCLHTHTLTCTTASKILRKKHFGET